MELIKIENDVALLDEHVMKDLVELEKNAKFIKEAQEKYKQAILEEMEARNIIKIDTPELMINYIAPSDRETFDSKKFKEEHQDLYDDYVKMTPVKSCIKIKVK